MNNKQKFALSISGAAVILFAAGFLFYPYLLVKALSIDILPDTINNAELSDVYEEVPGQGIVEGLTAYYQSENQDINVLFWKLESEAIAKDGQEQFLNDLKIEYDSMFDSVDWSVNHEFTVEEHKAYAATFRAYLAGEYHDGGIMFAAVGEFFLVVQIVNYNGAPAFSELQTALAILINNVPGEAPPPPSDGDEGEQGEQGEEEEEKEVCGNNNCEYWAGENCDNCFDDCLYPFQSQGFCCYVGYKYIYAHNYHNEIYDLHEALAGLIPEGTIMVDPDLNEDNMPLRPPYICYNRGIKTGECIFNYDCPSGLCTTENWCVELRSEEPQEIKDEKIAEDIYKDATNYKEEYVEAYEKIQGGIGQMVIKDAKLDVKLEIQGSTAGKLPKVSRGDEIEVRLEITNNSDYQLGLTAGIFYPGYDTGMFDLEEKKYTLSFDWDGGLSSLIGSFETKLINSKFIIMPSGSKIVVYSKVVPKQTGYLDVQGLVFFATEKKYQDYDPGFLDEAPKSYQESEVSETILVEEKPCNWWPICL